jgi:hypothetical protein
MMVPNEKSDSAPVRPRPTPRGRFVPPPCGSRTSIPHVDLAGHCGGVEIFGFLIHVVDDPGLLFDAWGYDENLLEIPIEMFG